MLWTSRNRLIELELRVSELERLQNSRQLEHAEQMVNIERMYHRLRMISKRERTAVEDAAGSPNGGEGVLDYLARTRRL